MKFGNSIYEKADLDTRYWHKVYAWFPTRLDDGRTVWFEEVWKRDHFVYLGSRMCHYTFYTQYEPKVKQENAMLVKRIQAMENAMLLT